MFTAEIGRIIFTRWQVHNQRPEVTVREYFDQEFFPLFFDDERYLMLANNSKFDQAYKNKKKTPLLPEIRKQALKDFHLAVSSLDAHEGHLYMGGYSKNREDATAGQITDLEIPLNLDEIYYSWLGLAAGIGIKGGMSILTSIPEILDQIVEGWRMYRQFMGEQPTLKPHQIDTWNGWWIFHRNDTDLYSMNDPLRDFVRDETLLHKDGVTSLQTIDWSKIMFTLAQYSQKEESTLVYVYSLGQTNTSIGFIPILLQQIQRLPQLHKQLFGTSDGPTVELFKKLYETHMGFISACRLGVIGLRSLEPKGLHALIFPTGKNIGRPITLDGAQFTIQQKFHQTWITAMLNNEELLHLASSLAALLGTVSPAKRGKTTTDNRINSILEANGKRQFIEAITELLNDKEIALPQPEIDLPNIDKVVVEIVGMPVANIPLFITLLRYKYAFINQTK
ncbi:MAG: hypothetical protein H6555_07790 [Lewinellaceae bacterium]|nr:hypothetical protein [Lewinellaceae bacterium]